MIDKANLDCLLATRVSQQDRVKFSRKAAKYGGISEVLREFIIAFNENRLTIKQNPNKESLYEPRKED